MYNKKISIHKKKDFNNDIFNKPYLNTTNNNEIKEISNEYNTENFNNDTLNKKSFIKALDNNYKEEIEILFNECNKNGIEKDIVFELYKDNQLNCE